MSQIAASSAMRATDSKKAKKSGLDADPASLSFASTDTAAKSIKISGERDGTYDVSIAGTGPCPTVAPASLKLKKRDDEHGEHGRNHDHQDSDEAVGSITVTPAAPSGGGTVVRGGGGGSAAGPAQCVITIVRHDRDASDDNAEHEHERGATPLLIPVTVAGGATPSPSPSPVPTPAPTDTPAPTATPVPTATPCGARGC